MKKRLYSDIWVYGDLRSGRFFEFSLKVLAAAVKLSLNASGQAAMIFAAKPEKTGSNPTEEAFPAVPLDQAGKSAGWQHHDPDPAQQAYTAVDQRKLADFLDGIQGGQRILENHRLQGQEHRCT